VHQHGANLIDGSAAAEEAARDRDVRTRSVQRLAGSKAGNEAGKTFSILLRRLALQQASEVD
jgi:hypothetical protein